MSMAYLNRRSIGRTGLDLPRLGFGCAEIGGLLRPVSEADAEATLRAAWSLGIRYYDVAPVYGYGRSEMRLGRFLRGIPRNDYVLSTKVGHPTPAKFDYTRDGVLRDFEASLKRLGVDRVDILYIHDPDDYWQDVVDGAYPALHRLREEGVVGAIGAGMGGIKMLTRLAYETEMDIFLLSNRYSLVDQTALPEFLPACVERGSPWSLVAS